MNPPIRIMLVEDQAAYREVISLVLKYDANMELVSQFSSMEIALQNLRNPSASQKPDLMLLDLRLPGMSGLEAIPLIQQNAPNTKIIVLTQSDAEADVLEAIQAGATGYLLKSASPRQIRESIHSAMEGGAPLDARIARFILNTLKGTHPTAHPGVVLSKREMEILTLMNEGKVKKEIAATLAISYATVDTHIRHIYHKLQVKNAPAAIGKAYKQGILPQGNASTKS